MYIFQNENEIAIIIVYNKLVLNFGKADMTDLIVTSRYFRITISKLVPN